MTGPPSLPRRGGTGGGTGEGGFLYETSLKYLILPVPQAIVMVSCNPEWTPTFLVHPSPQLLCSSYTNPVPRLYIFHVQISAGKGLQENNNTIEFKTHKYNTDFKSGEMFDMEMNKNYLHHF